jgi:branched-subunit amino acid ABC-type transport system permease component
MPRTQARTHARTRASELLGRVDLGEEGGVERLFAGLALGLRANQVAVGLAVGILGQGLSSLVGNSYESLTITGLPKLAFPGLSDLPVVGRMFEQDIIVWLSLLATAAIWAMFRYYRLGLILRAIGENPAAARAIGYRVTALRFWAVVFGGAMAGFAGAYAATVYTPLWADGMIAGRGWIALALVVFGTWLTSRIFFGAVLFGALSLASLVAALFALYLVAIFVGTVIVRRKRVARGDKPNPEDDDLPEDDEDEDDEDKDDGDSRPKRQKPVTPSDSSAAPAKPKSTPPPVEGDLSSLD